MIYCNACNIVISVIYHSVRIATLKKNNDDFLAWFGINDDRKHCSHYKAQNLLFCIEWALAGKD